MASIPGVRFGITGASGSQGLLSPKNGWRAYIFPRGGHASQDSTGTTITFDSADVASRFAVNDWIQVALSTSNIRKVNAVGGNSISFGGAAVTVAENERIFLIGSTQPSITGGSATYIIPRSVIRQRDDSAADIFTNSMITSNSDGLIQFWSDEPALYDAIIQDGNQGNQGSIIDLAVGAVEGISTSLASVFGATVTFLAGVSMNQTLIVGQSVTLNGALGVTGWATFGSTVTMNAAFGVTGTAALGATTTVTGNASFGSTVTVDGALGVTGTVTFNGTMNTTRGIQQTGFTGTNSWTGAFATSRDVTGRRLIASGTTPLGSTYFTLSSGWGASASVTVGSGAKDAHGSVQITSTGTGQGANPTVGISWADGNWSAGLSAVVARGTSTHQLTVPVLVNTISNSAGLSIQFQGTPSAGETYEIYWMVMG